MSRETCHVCLRPAKVCLCPFIRKVHNLVELGILQHPSETQQIKGTAKIAQLALTNHQMWIGERVEDCPGLVDWLTDGKPIFLLYPLMEEGAIPESFTIPEIKATHLLSKIKVLVLDGTWRKTHKMMMLNPMLQTLPRIEIQPTLPSAYLIRKQKNADSLSTIEAIYSLLTQLESSDVKFAPLLEAFQAMVQQQLAFRRS